MSIPRRTKIVATVGPATDSNAALDALIAAGVDIVRLNFSHGTHESQGATFTRVREAAARAGKHVAILQDLGGPKIRTGRLKNGGPVELIEGAPLTIATGDFEGDASRVSTKFDGLARGVKAGDRLLLSDGTIELNVESTTGKEIRTVVVEGGPLGERKGISAPGVVLPVSAVTLKDAEDLQFGLSLGVDMVAISFVQTPQDLRQARGIMEADGASVPLVAKLERPAALDRLDDILAEADAVMVARGDLGLEMPLEGVPRAQKAITRRARDRRIPVIVATQVLESMTTEARPTRAEASDAANAVEDGVDAIMLSGETAVGRYPAKAVQTLDAIIRDAESAPVLPLEALREILHPSDDRDHARAICEAAVTLAGRSGADAIVAVTRAGTTAHRLSSLRPKVPVIATTDRDETARRMMLLWGVTPVQTDIGENVDQAGALICQDLIARGMVRPGASVVLVNIHPDLARRDANYLKIQRL